MVQIYNKLMVYSVCVCVCVCEKEKIKYSIRCDKHFCYIL